METGMSGNCLSCRKGVKDPFEVQDGRCDFPRDATVEKGLISLGGRTFWIFLSLCRFLWSYNGDLRDPLVWPQDRPGSMKVARGLSVFLSSQCRVLIPHLESRQETELSRPVLTWILALFWHLHKGARPHLE